MPHFGHVQRTIGPRGITYRSKMEANYASYLEFLQTRGIIRDWRYEPVTLWFTPWPPPKSKRATCWNNPKHLGLAGVSRGKVSYTPDFSVDEWDKKLGKIVGYYVEVKGYMDARSKTVLARARRYFPGVRFEVIDGPFMASLKRAGVPGVA